ncbi:acyltransferase family protein [Sphingomonas lacusdianchii]|uniref:acyltransferase family protein n=1 Tax=Sphingomonas lacusdianchii TaxID=2917992 RepID=UPI003D6770DA
MHRNLSIYLEVLRFAAAVAVVLSHARGILFPALPWRLAAHGPEAVAVFFVLSGFVIRFVTVDRNETTWRAYAAARVARIYPRHHTGCTSYQDSGCSRVLFCTRWICRIKPWFLVRHWCSNFHKRSLVLARHVRLQ